jgi:predicted SAM-dependent methyltransferase
MSSRSEALLAPVPRGGRLIEIGPSFSPIAPKAEGWNTLVVDHLTREGLVAKYTGHPGVDVARIEDVDVVWTGGPIVEAVDRSLHGTFDAFIASHVIEHTPDLLAFLGTATTLLKQDGVVVLAIPDKRYCFDFFQPLTTAGQVLAAAREQRTRHTPRLAFDYLAYSAADGDSHAWGQHPVTRLRLPHTLEQARGYFEAASRSTDYIDLHAWRFTPASFELLLLDLAWLGETDWRVERTTPASGCEFFAWLRRGGMAAAAALSAEAFNARRLDLLKLTLLEQRAQIDWLLAGEPTLAAVPPALLPSPQPAPPSAAPRV